MLFKRASPIPPTPFLPWAPWWFGESGRGSRKDETRQFPDTLFVASASAIWGWHCKRSTRRGPWDMERWISSESSCQRIHAPLVLVTGRDPEEQHISKCFTTCVTLGNQIRNPCAECQLLTEIALLFHESALHRGEPAENQRGTRITIAGRQNTHPARLTCSHVCDWDRFGIIGAR